MLLGVNWISPNSLPIIRDLLKENIADFCEIMVDNFVHLPARAILEALSDTPISLHIVASRFLEKTPDELKLLANYLRPWIRDLKPLYVSDHLIRFTSSEGKLLPLISELNYATSFTHAKERVSMWQEMLDTPLLLENHASLTALGSKQAAFFKALIDETKVCLLFDFSNAYIAEHNQIALRQSWDTLIQHTNHFHVAGFRIDEVTNLALDTHEESLSEEVLNDIHKHLHNVNHHNTLVIEFNAKVDKELWKENILHLKKNLSTFQNLPFNSNECVIETGDQQLEVIAKHNLRHRLFQYCPHLMKISSNGDDIFEPFLYWTNQEQLVMDWTLHFFLLQWLQQHEKWMQQVTPEIVKELMIASVIRWSLSGFEHLHAKGIIVTTPFLQNVAILLWKNKEVDKSNKIIVLHHENIKLKLPCYAILYKYGDLENLTWQAIPYHVLIR